MDGLFDNTDESHQHFFHGMIHTSKFGIKALGCGKCQYKFRLENPIENRTLRFYCLIMITRGRAFFKDEINSTIECQKGDSFLLTPQTHHSYGVIKDSDFEETWIAFDGTLIDQLFLDHQIPHDRTFFPNDGNNIIMDLFEKSFDYASSIEIVKQQQLPALFLQILTFYLESRHLSDSPTWLDKALQHINNHIEKNIDMQELATECGVSYSGFRALFKKSTGLSPGLYHLKQKMNRAGQYLIQGLSVSETAQKVGIEDVYYFSRIFKKHMNCPPVEYIKIK